MPGWEIIGLEEKQALCEIFENSGGVLFAHGFDAKRKGHFRVREFEKQLAEYFGCPKTLAVNSGTAAIKVALRALGVKPGDEVITQAFTFIATVEAILDLGAIPILVNSDASLNLDPAELEKKITSKTKAILPVHMLGFSCQMDEIMAIAKKHRLPVVEDNCESVGARWGDRYLGLVGQIGTFSFDFGKMITTGEGGLVLTQDPAHDKIAREFHDHGHENNPKLPRGKDTRSIYGFNYRMTEMQAAVGMAQLKKLDFILRGHQERYEALESGLGEFSGMIRRERFSKSKPTFDTFMFGTSDSSKRTKLLQWLHQNGVGTKNVPDAIEWHFAGYWEHIFSKSERDSWERTRLLLEQFVSIPISLLRSVEDYRKVGSKLSEIARE